MSGTSFDEATSKRIERMYGAQDLVRRREFAREALAPAPGARILDIGCGPGFYEAEISPDVGPAGLVVGVDSSQDMLALARARCADLANVEFRQGEATALPTEDSSFDGVLCVQVLEYVPDVAGALAAMHRTLAAGGRVVIWDTDWATLSWHSSDPARMQRVLHAFDEHLEHPSLPRRLGPLMRAAGFTDVSFIARSFATDELSHETYGGQLLGLVRGFVPGHQGITADEVGAWTDDQRTVAELGEFFCSATQFCFVATKAG